MDAQRLRNLTTMRLHTEMAHIYDDIEVITGSQGVMTHQLGMACRALKPYLEAQQLDPRFWDGKYDTAHVGEVQVRPMNDSEREEYFQRFKAQPNPLFS